MWFVSHKIGLSRIQMLFKNLLQLVKIQIGRDLK